MNARTKWVDVAKFMAIIAVMIDHTIGILYSDGYIQFFSFYSVSLFILIMGITTMWSYSKNSYDLCKKSLNKCLKILRPYAVATIIYSIFSDRVFNFEAILNRFIHFNASPPFYYVLLYIQLVIISPLLFYVFKIASQKKLGLAIESIAFLVVLGISSLTTNYSNILGVYGGGGKLFGGTYLILLYLGMWFGKYCNRISVNSIIAGILSAISCGCAIAWFYFISHDFFKIDAKIPFGYGLNPPSISLGLYAILVAATLYFLELFLKRFSNGLPQKLMDKIAFIGKHTLYIFLYHCFFLNIVFPRVSAMTEMVIGNWWIKRIVYFTCMIAGSMLIEFILERIHNIVFVAYKSQKERE
ncbi:MAG: acyltransferase [Lachnospiraceae bacterium]|nr:acyltransferase [Lachnospiraceae bacterium]